MTRVRTTFALVLGASLALGACQVLFPITDESAVPVEAGVESGPTATDAGATPDVCSPQPPAPPNADMSGSGENLSFAIRTVTFDTVAGYDLDGLDTLDAGDGGSIAAPCKGSPVDLTCGVDKAFNAALGILPGGAASADFRINSLTEPGTKSVLFRLYKAGPTLPSNVNGVQLAVATATLSTVGCEFPFVEVDGSTPPRWDGCDTWVHEDFAGRTSDTGYVKDGVLVAKYKSLPVTLGELTLTMSAAVITAHVVTVDGGTLTLQKGIIAGRVNAQEAIGAAARFHIKATPACLVPGALPMLEDAICAHRDLPGATTSYSPAATCDSLSIAIGFEAVAAGSNGTITYDAGPDPCMDLVDAACP